MRTTVFAGPYYFWNMRQCAVAAERFPGLPPTREGLEMLQECWRECGVDSPPKNAQVGLSWAQAAFRDLNQQLQYEQVPA